MPAIITAEEIELAILAGVCVAGGMLGTRLKYHSPYLRGERRPLDKQALFSGLYVAGGAGLVTALIGQSMHINRGALIGASIVAGYAGGPRFFDWIQRILERLSARKLLDGVKTAAGEIETELKKLDANGDDEEQEEKPP